MELNNWVSDKLHDILGFSDRHTVEYLVSLSKSTKTSHSFHEKLQGFLGSEDANILSFANDLWQRVPHQEVGENPNRAREREIIAQQKRNMSYRMLSDDDDDEIMEALAAKSSERKNAKRRKHLRKKAAMSESSEEEAAEEKASNSESGDEWEKSEKDRMKDLEERDAFSARLKEKDKEKQRNVVERSDRKVG